MLSLQVEDLLQEIKDAENFRDNFLAGINDLIRRIPGKFWRKDLETKPTPENYAWAYLGYTMPQLSFEVPGCEISPIPDTAGGEIAESGEIGLNHWCREVSVTKVLDEAAFECVAGICMTQVGVEARGDFNPSATGGAAGVHGDFQMMPNYPFVDRIPRNRIILDAYCDNVESARLIGRQYERDLEDLQQDERYPGAAKLQQYNDNTANANDPFQRKGQPNRRKTVTLYEIYLPEHKMILTIAKMAGAGGEIIRQEDYVGPDEGPFKLWGLYWIPGVPYPVPPLIAVFEQFLELQDHATKASVDAATSKKVGIVETQDAELGGKLEKAKNGDIITARTLNGYQEADVGGPPQFTLAYIQDLKIRLDNIMGFSQTQRGNASPGATARDVMAAKSEGDLRIKYMQSKFTECVAAMYQQVFWFLCKDPSVSFRTVKTDPVSGNKQAVVFAGGVWPGQEMYDPADFNVTVDPKSLEREDDALKQKRAQDLLQIIAAIAPMLVQMPFINWAWLLDTVGDSMGYKRLSEKVLNVQMLQAMGILINMQGPPAPGGPGMPKQGGAMPMGQGGVQGMGMIPGMGATSQGAGPVGMPGLGGTDVSAMTRGLGGSRPGA